MAVYVLAYPFRQLLLDFISCKFCNSLFNIGECSQSHSDAFPKQSTEVFVLQMMLKNFLFFAFSNFINSWAAEAGAGAVFQVFGIISLALLAVCIPMCKSPEIVPRPTTWGSPAQAIHAGEC